MLKRRDLLRGSSIRRFAALLLVLRPLAARAAEPGDGRLAANPALARIAAADPDEARRLLGDIDEALRRPARPRMRGGSPGVDAADRALLEENPLLGQVYAHDAAAALALLERVKAAAPNGSAPR